MPNPYNYNFDDETQSYHFTTKNGIEYKVAFIVDHTFSAVSNIEIDNVFQLIIEKEDDGIERYDSQVSETVKDIVASFFLNSQNSMIYICDDEDSKAETRFKVFDRWYQSSTLTDYVFKVDNVIECDSPAGITTIYSSLLYHNENINKEEIIDIYNNIQEILNDK